MLLIIQQELAKRCKKSKTRGRRATSAEVVLRMMLLKHVRDWSYEELIREVRANLVYREFTRIGGDKVPDDKTMSRLGRQLGPEVVAKVHDRVVAVASENGVAKGRKLRDPHCARRPDEGRRVVIDSSSLACGRFGDAGLKSGYSGYPYPMYAYIRSQERLHPAIDAALHENVVV